MNIKMMLGIHSAHAADIDPLMANDDASVWNMMYAKLRLVRCQDRVPFLPCVCGLRAMLP